MESKVLDLPPLSLVERRLCETDAHAFVFEYCRTKDEHDLDVAAKAFPDKAHLRVLLDLLLLTGGCVEPERARWATEAGVDALGWWRAGQLGIEKSRQIMATWLVAAYCLWRAKYRKNQLILWQSKKEEDAANVVFNKSAEVARISFMESMLPAHLQDGLFPARASWCNLYFPRTNSRIWGIPEGGDIVRSNTASVLVSDEAAFQPQWESAKDAAQPALHGGGQLVAISSAAPGAFARWVGAEG